MFRLSLADKKKKKKDKRALPPSNITDHNADGGREKRPFRNNRKFVTSLSHLLEERWRYFEYNARQSAKTLLTSLIFATKFLCLFLKGSDLKSEMETKKHKISNQKQLRKRKM